MHISAYGNFRKCTILYFNLLGMVMVDEALPGKRAETQKRWASLFVGEPLMGNTEPHSVLAKKLVTFFPLSADELGCLADIQSAPQGVKRGRQLVQEGQTGQAAFVLQAGWGCSYKDLPNGGRQIISFPIAGDCVGLRSVPLQTADHSFSALTDAVVSSVSGAHIMKCVTEFPRLAAALLWAASRDEAMVVEHLVNVGRRSALERTAHFFMELAERLTLIGLATKTEFKCPLSQFVLADALGLTAIHVNRTLRQLRELNLLTLSKGSARIHDLGRLKELAGYQGGYLNSDTKLLARH
jgi:CRP-like cAMP-binding protein